MFKDSIRAYRIYHISALTRRFKLLFFTELSIYYGIGFYLCRIHHKFSSIFLIGIPAIIFVALVCYVLTSFVQVSTVEKSQFYRMLPNEYVTFKRALQTTITFVFVLSIVAGIVTLVMANDGSWIYPYSYIYTMITPVCIGFLYLFLKSKGNVTLYFSLLVMLVICVFFSFISMRDMQTNVINNLGALFFSIVCFFISVYFLNKTIKYIEGRWFV